MALRTRFSESIEEVTDAIEPGACVAIGGARLMKKPMALIRELLRRRVGNLELLTTNASIGEDLLIGAGLVRQLTFTFCNLDVVGSAPSFRRAAQSGELRTLEFGTLALIRSLEAAERDVPVGFARSLIGSDLMKYHPGTPRQVDDQLLLEVPAYHPDVAIIHAPYADVNGNVLIAHEGFDFQLAKAANRCIVTVDRILSDAEFSARGRVVLQSRDVDFVVVAPWAAHPTSSYPIYSADIRHVIGYAESAEDGRSREYIEHYIDGKTEAEYRDIVGSERLVQLERLMDLGRAAGGSRVGGGAW